MNTRVAMLAAISLLIASIASAGAAGNGIDALLQSYSVPNSIISSLQAVNVTYNGGTYALLYAGSSLEFVVNVTSTPTVLANQSEIASIITNRTLAMSYAEANFSSLEKEMNKFEQSGQGTITDCLIETGLYQTNNTCTLANYCNSCATVPVCSKVLNGVGGPDTSFGFGIMNFESNYTELTDAYAGFNAEVSSISPGDIQQVVPELNSSLLRISQITSTMGNNPVFPPPDLTSQQVSTCISYGSNLNAAPWYCGAVGYCEALSFNTTALNQTRANLDAQLALPFTQQQIYQIAGTAANNANLYITPTLQKQQTARLDGILNTTLLAYSSTVLSVNTLLSHISNASLSAQLSSFQANYSHLLSDYQSLNLTQQNESMAKQQTALVASYDRLNASYSGAVKTAQNNTALLVAAQLEGNSNPSIPKLAFEQMQLNADLKGKVSNITQIDLQMQQVHSQLEAAGAASQSTDALHTLSASIATAITPSFGYSYNQAVGVAPLAGALPFIIIGIILLLAGLLMYRGIGSKKQKTISLAGKKQAKRMGRNIWLVVAAIGLLLIIIPYAYASMANASAPLSSFASAVKSSNTLVVALNGTTTQGMQSCASEITSIGQSMHKTVQTVEITGDKCTAGSSIQTTSACMNGYAARSVPVVMLTNANVTKISLYSYYGTVLSVSGNSTSMADCPAALMVG